METLIERLAAITFITVGLMSLAFMAFSGIKVMPSAFFIIGLYIWVLRTWKREQLEES